MDIMKNMERDLLKRLIERKIGTFIADEIIKNNIRKESAVFLDIKNNNLTLKVN